MESASIFSLLAAATYLLAAHLGRVSKIVWDDGDAGTDVEGAHFPRGEAQAAGNALVLPHRGLVGAAGAGQASGACVRRIVGASRARQQRGRGGKVAVGAA